MSKLLHKLAVGLKTHPYESEVPTPQEIFERASKVILHQDAALKQLASAIHTQLLAIENQQKYNARWLLYDKLRTQKDKLELSGDATRYSPPRPTGTKQPPIFLTGGTGSGKTHLVKQLCQMFDINFIIVDSTHLSPASYRGTNLVHVGKRLKAMAENDAVKLRHSVVFFDEFDKLFATDARDQHGQYRRTLAMEMLSIIEGTAPFPTDDDASFDSSNLLFILGGSFAQHFRPNQSIGFTQEIAAPSDGKKFVPTSLKSLAEFGLPDELIGRMGKIIIMSPLDHSMLTDIFLNSPISPFVQVQTQLKRYNCKLVLADDFLDLLIKNNQKSIDQFGVRGLYQSFTNLDQLSEILYQAASQKDIDETRCYYLMIDDYDCFYEIDDYDEVIDPDTLAQVEHIIELNSYRISDPDDDIPF